ncbi:hypothetical protein SpCBS45565_g07421 [Spizellomyces sp. 'palustris']|nr:hypothetical protein SpCBS45565_g07421 [Spizellomyces sp. 'palustris']
MAGVENITSVAKPEADTTVPSSSKMSETTTKDARRAARQEKRKQGHKTHTISIPSPPRAPTPPPRRMIPVTKRPIPRPTTLAACATPLRSITIMTYNILAQCLCRRELYPYCGKNDLKGKTRFPMIIEEITKRHRPDIACLQEVDHFDDLLAPELQSAGYDYEYLKKNPEKEFGHGLCILWKKEMFAKHKCQSIFFDDSPLTHPTPVTPVTHNIGQLLALKFLLPSLSPAHGGVPGVVITNSHLYWRPRAQYEKLRQAYVMLEEVVRFKRNIEEEEQPYPSERSTPADSLRSWPVFLCGDWNTSPEDGLYRCLTKQPLTADQRAKLDPTNNSEDSADAGDESILPPVPEAATNAKPVENPVPTPVLVSRISKLPRLHSCYSTYRDTDENHPVNPDWTEGDLWENEPTYTNFSTWKGTLDYIFVADESARSSTGGAESDSTQRRIPTAVQVSKVLDIPHAQYLAPGLPNPHFPSDHVCLMAEVELY